MVCKKIGQAGACLTEYFLCRLESLDQLLVLEVHNMEMIPSSKLKESPDINL